MATKTIQLTYEQVELAKMTVEADRAVGRRTDRLIAIIAGIGSEPITVAAGDLDDTEGPPAVEHQPTDPPAT